MFKTFNIFKWIQGKKKNSFVTFVVQNLKSNAYCSSISIALLLFCTPSYWVYLGTICYSILLENLIDENVALIHCSEGKIMQYLKLVRATYVFMFYILLTNRITLHGSCSGPCQI